VDEGFKLQDQDPRLRAGKRGPLGGGGERFIGSPGRPISRHGRSPAICRPSAASQAAASPSTGLPISAISVATRRPTAERCVGAFSTAPTTWPGRAPATSGDSAQLELAVLIDFRSSAEKALAPNRLPRGHGIKIVELPLFDDADDPMGVGLRAQIERGDLAGIDAAALLIDANQRLATKFTPVYRQFIAELLAAGGAPVLFHCTAGKDRTGFAAALVLRLLGVPEEVIVADYLRSNTYSLTAHRRTLFLLRLFKGQELTALVRALLGVEEAYLQATFEAIDREYGSFAAYVRDGLGLSEADIERLRDLLLEEAGRTR